MTCLSRRCQTEDVCTSCEQLSLELHLQGWEQNPYQLALDSLMAVALACFLVLERVENCTSILARLQELLTATPNHTYLPKARSFLEGEAGGSTQATLLLKRFWSPGWVAQFFGVLSCAQKVCGLITRQGTSLSLSLSILSLSKSVLKKHIFQGED